jgi:sugar phosphate isomerase/epimerase
MNRIRSSITVSLVPEARGGPFVFWDDLPGAARRAKEYGFDAIEVFPPGPEAIDAKAMRTPLDDHGLALAAVGTGAGLVKHRLTLSAEDAGTRAKARDFVRSIIEAAGTLGASAIIGSMQGRSGGGVDKMTAKRYLAEALDELGEAAATFGVPLLYEPLNRYETDLVNTVKAGLELLDTLSTDNVKLLCDLFHMNIEEADIAAALRLGGDRVGHVHFVDSNRWAAGMGHLEFWPIAEALEVIRYDGYASAECFPLTSPDVAAAKTIETFRRVFGAERSH